MVFTNWNRRRLEEATRDIRPEEWKLFGMRVSDVPDDLLRAALAWTIKLQIEDQERFMEQARRAGWRRNGP